MDGFIGELTGLAAVVLIFGSVPAIIVAAIYFKSKERQKTQDMIRLAIERGQPLPTDLVEAITRDVKPRPSRQRDLRVGIMWIAVAAGMVAFAYALGYGPGPDAFWPLIGLAAFPGFIGVALLVMALLNGRGNLD
jgi:hypothetical protein